MVLEQWSSQLACFSYKLQSLQLDMAEFACVNAIMLFEQGNWFNLHSTNTFWRILLAPRAYDSAGFMRLLVVNKAKPSILLAQCRVAAVSPNSASSLKLFTLFSFYYSESSSGLKNRKMVDFILNRSLDALRDYIKCSYPDKPSRFAHILLRLPTLRQVSSKMATECLFAKSFLNLAVPQVMSFVMEMKVEIWKSLAYHWNIAVSLLHFDFFCFWFL